MGRWALNHMQHRKPYSNVGIGSKLIIPWVSVEQGIDQYTVYTIEAGMAEQDDRTVPMLFICGTGKTSKGKNKNVRLIVPPEELETYLAMVHWELVEEVTVFNDAQEKQLP